MVADLTTLISRVRSVVRDASGDFITPDDIVQWINEAVTDIAARQGLIESEFTGTTVDETIELPPSVGTETLTIDYLSLGSSGDEVVFVDDEIWQSYVDASASPVFTIGRVYNELIFLYPTPTAGTAYTLRCTSVPPPLVVGGNDIHTLPLHMEKKIVDFAIAKAMYKEGELERGDRFYAMYEDGLHSVASGRETQRPGPFTLVPIEGPFDVDWEGRHW